MSLQVWLPLNGDLHNQGLKQYNLSMFRGSEIYNNNGKIGKCFYANGVNTIKILNIIPDFYNYSAYSLCAWIYIEAQNTSHTGCGIISAGNWNSQVLNLGLSDWSTNHYTRLRISGTNWSRTYAYNFSLNTWYHIVVSSDSNKTYAYVNGVLIGDSQTSFLPTSIEGDDICIGGATYYSGMQFFGRINDVRIYDHCLSDKEVEEIAKGLVLHYKLDNNGIGGNNLATNTAFPTSAIQGYNGQNAIEYNHSDWTSGGRFFAGYSSSQLTFTEIQANQPYTISAWVYIYNDVTLSNPGGTSIFYRIYKTGDSPTYSYDIAVTLNGIAQRNQWVKVSSTFISPVTYTYNQGGTFSIGGYNGHFLVSMPQVELGSTATPWSPNPTDSGIDSSIVYDSSGYNNYGELYNYDTNGSITTTSDSPKYDISTFINSASNTTNTASGTRYIYGHCALTNPTAMSVAFWCKPIAGYGNSTGQGQFCTTTYEFGNANAGSDYQASAMNHRDSAVDINDSASTTQCRPTFLPTANEWHHYAITYDGQTGKVYKDGVQSSTASFSAAKTLDSFIGVIIGFSKAGGVWRSNQSYFSDFRIYATALTAEQILELYHTSATIDNKGNIYARKLVEE